MALSKSQLKGRIISELQSAGFAPAGNGSSVDPTPWIDKFAEAVANAVVDEIVANSELVPISTDSGSAGSGIISGKVK